jgi:hypothetical protein
MAILLVGMAYLFTKQTNIDNRTTTISNPVNVPVIVNPVVMTLPPAATAVPEPTVVYATFATYTAVPENLPTPLPPSTGLYAIILAHGETAVTECMSAMATGELLTLKCLTIKSQLEFINK